MAMLYIPSGLNLVLSLFHFKLSINEISRYWTYLFLGKLALALNSL